MKKTSQTIVFFGSGPVAAESLRLLLKDFVIEAVITKPTTERAMIAVAGDVPVYTVTKKSDLGNLIENEQFQSNLGVLIDFGIIVSQKVIDYFPLGIINSHFSILPEWRGADPINFAILSGQEVTGVSLMLIVEAMDEGPLLTYSTYQLPTGINSHELTNNLIHMSANMLKQIVPKYIAGELKAVEQSHTNRTVSYSRKLTKQDGILDFKKTAKELEAQIRAFVEWPKSRTEIADKDVVVVKASIDKIRTGKPGEVYKTEDKKIGIQTSKGALIIEELKPAGKNIMKASAFLAGYGSKL